MDRNIFDDTAEDNIASRATIRYFMGRSTWIEIGLGFGSGEDVMGQDYSHFVTGEDMPFIPGTFGGAETVCVGVIGED